MEDVKRLTRVQMIEVSRCYYTVMLPTHETTCQRYFEVNFGRVGTSRSPFSRHKYFTKTTWFLCFRLMALTLSIVTCRSSTLWAVWHQGLLWSVPQHWHFLLECCCHQSPRGHGDPVSLRCTRRTYRPLQPDYWTVTEDWVYSAL